MAPVHFKNALAPTDLTDEPKLIADNDVHDSNAFEPMFSAPPSANVNDLMRFNPENARMPMVFTLLAMIKSPTMLTPALCKAPLTSYIATFGAALVTTVRVPTAMRAPEVLPHTS